jgi:hypothetical protein
VLFDHLHGQSRVTSSNGSIVGLVFSIVFAIVVIVSSIIAVITSDLVIKFIGETMVVLVISNRLVLGNFREFDGVFNFISVSRNLEVFFLFHGALTRE